MEIESGVARASIPASTDANAPPLFVATEEGSPARVLPRGEFLPVPLLSCITVGPPIWLEPKENKLQFLQRARDAVLRLKDV